MQGKTLQTSSQNTKKHQKWRQTETENSVDFVWANLHGFEKLTKEKLKLVDETFRAGLGWF